MASQSGRQYLPRMLALFFSLLAAKCYAGCPMKAAGQVFVGFSGGPVPHPVNIIDTPGAPWRPSDFSRPSSCSSSEYWEIAKAIRAAVPDKATAPSLLRLGFHTGGSYSAQVPSLGGVNGGWLQFAEEAANGRNAGLGDALAALKAIKNKHACITYADLHTFAGALGAELAGGPAVAWYPGRRDALGPGPSSPQFSSRLPDAMFNAAGVMYGFTNLGLTIREQVVFIGGGHSIGGADAGSSGWNGVFTPFGDNWPTPSNRYFVDLVGLDWQVDYLTPTAGGRLQYKPTSNDPKRSMDGEGASVLRLPSDIAFKESDVFSEWSKVYARDEALFVKDFTRTMQRYLQLGAGSGYSLNITAFHWKGFESDSPGFGPQISPLLDTDGY